MHEVPVTQQGPLPPKAKLIVTSLLDIGIDLLLPTAIFALLAPTGLSALVRLTIGGFFVAAKASAGRFSAPHEPEAHPSFGRSFLVGIVIAAVCTAVTVSTTYAGGSDTLAIGMGTSVLLSVQGIHLVRRWRRLDGFAILVLIELATTVVLTSISNNPRFVLIRPSFYTAIAAIYVLTTVRMPQPFMMQVSKPIAAGGDPVRAEAFERAGLESSRFRRAEQAMTVGLAITLLAESVLRVLTVFSRPATDVLASSFWSQVWAIGLFALYFRILKLVLIPRVRREVDALMPKKSAHSRCGKG
jgi:hypothetical protein